MASLTGSGSLIFDDITLDGSGTRSKEVSGAGIITTSAVFIDSNVLQNEQLFPSITFSKTKDQAVTYNSEPVIVSATVSHHNEMTSANLSINSVGSYTGNYKEVSSTEFIIEITCPRTGTLTLTAIGNS